MKYIKSKQKGEVSKSKAGTFVPLSLHLNHSSVSWINCQYNGSLADVYLKNLGNPKTTDASLSESSLAGLLRVEQKEHVRNPCSFVSCPKTKVTSITFNQYSSAYLIPKQSQRFFQPLALLWAPTPTHSTTHTRWHLSLTLEPPSCKICLVCSWLVLDGISGWEQRSNLSWNDYNYVVSIYSIYIAYIIYMIMCCWKNFLKTWCFWPNSKVLQQNFPWSDGSSGHLSLWG